MEPRDVGFRDVGLPSIVECGKFALGSTSWALWAILEPVIVRIDRPRALSRL